MTKLSVIIPVYNAEKYLEECVQSILQQSFSGFELLLINDGSSDSSGIMCDTFAKKDARIRVFHKENGGVSSARNLGLDNAHGEWICFVDSDDWLEPGYFEVLEESDISDYELIQAGVKLLNISNNTVILRQHKNQKISRLDLFEKDNFCSYSVCYFFKQQKINSLELRFNENVKFSEDREFIIKMALNVNYVKQTNKSIYVYRLNESSATIKKRAYEHFFDDLKVLDELLKYAEDNVKNASKKELNFISRLLINSYIFLICKNYSKKIEIDQLTKELKTRLILLKNKRILYSPEFFMYKLFTSFPVLSVVAYRIKQHFK